MKTVFIADAHLRSPEDSNYILLLRFLEEVCCEIENLCILGDLFDFRIGIPSLTFPEHEPLIDALAMIRSRGTRVIYLEGNHDFHLARSFSSKTGFELHSGPVEIELHGRRIFLCHGDLVNPADWRYRLLHLAIRNRLTAHAGRLLPEAAVQGVRRRLQHTSRKRYARDKSRWDYEAIIRSYGEKVKRRGFDALVLGHFHLPFMDESEGFTLLSLGDWIGQFSYGLLDGDHFSLCSFS